MRFHAILPCLCVFLLIPNLVAEDADDLRIKGIAALKESQTNAHAIVDAARYFVKAAELYSAAGNEEKSVEMNSFLYWCKKKMTLQDIDAFTKGGEVAVSTKLATVEKLSPKADEAQAWFERAEKFATANPDEHLLIAIRFFEVADRFQGSSASLKAQDRSLKELVQDKSTGAKTIPPPVAIATPKPSPSSSGTQPLPPASKLKEAEKTIKDLFKAEYAKTDSAGRLALVAKLLQQADENKDDPASLYVLLHEARDLSVAAGDSAQALAAQKRLCTAFNFDFAAIQNDLKALDATAKTEALATALASLYSAAAEDALEADNFDQAVRFNLHTDDMLPLIKDAATKARLKMEIESAKALKRDSVPALAALKTLSAKPDDPEANLAAGKFALQRRRFEAAFPHLAKGKDVGLSSLAKRELAPPAEAAEQVKLADGWFERAEREPYPYLKVPLQERAAFWYGNALPALAGLAKLKIETRMKTLPKMEVAAQPKVSAADSSAAKTSQPPSPPENRLTPTTAKKPTIGTIGNLSKEWSLDLGGDVMLEFVAIPSGTFEMGSPANEKGRGPAETQHTVTISTAFYMGKYPVTQEQYRAVTGKTAARFNGAKNPIEQVSWNSAQEFCKLLHEKAEGKLPKGMDVQLPTEAQWEFACRAGTSTRFYSGESDNDLDAVAWYAANSEGTTHPVGQKAPNAFGLYDMHGNVMQWCRDTFRPDVKNLPAVDPCNTADGSHRVVRGSSWRSDSYGCRAANRTNRTPANQDHVLGFRVAIVADTGIATPAATK